MKREVNDCSKPATDASAKKTVVIPQKELDAEAEKEQAATDKLTKENK